MRTYSEKTDPNGSSGLFNAYVAKIAIEKTQIYAEKANSSHGFGNLELTTFAPSFKNPAISKVFREIGLADELGSSMKNTYKYTQLYSGRTPWFAEGDVFRTVIPLNKANSTITVRPTTQVTTIVPDSAKDTKQKKFLPIQIIFAPHDGEGDV